MEGGKKEEDPSIPPTRPEKRRSLRSPILVMRVKGETENNIFFGYGKDISRGGMFISTVNPREIGETFYEPGMGIKFLDMEEDKRQRVEDWVNQRA